MRRNIRIISPCASGPVSCSMKAKLLIESQCFDPGDGSDGQGCELSSVIQAG